MKSFLLWFLDRPPLHGFASDWRWYRRLKGGRWEWWLMDVPLCTVRWFWVLPGDPERPHQLCRGTPVVEEY